MDATNADEPLSSDELIHRLERHRGAACPGCGDRMCLHELLMSIAIGAAERPRCLACLAQVLEESPSDLAGRLFQYCQSRTCYDTAWRYASTQEDVANDRLPDCLARRGPPSDSSSAE